MSNAAERLKNILVNDKQQFSKKINSILRSDLFILLKSYFDVSENEVVCNVQASDGVYKIEVSASARRIKNFIIIE